MKMRVNVYTPESVLRRPLEFFGSLLSGIGNARELAWILAMRDFKAQYRQSMAGYIWAFLPPFLASFTFILLRKGGVVEVGVTELPYEAYAIIGTLLWQVFVDAVMQPVKMMQTSKNMLTKINFPREALLMASVYYAFITLGIRLLVLIPVMFYFQLIPGPEFFYGAPFALFILVMLGAGVGIILAPLAGLYKDVHQLLTMVMTFWMFFTPVVFAGVRPGLTAQIMELNPVSHVLPLARSWLTGGFVSPDEITGFALVVSITFLFLFVGWLNFRVVLPRVVERLGM